MAIVKSKHWLLVFFWKICWYLQLLNVYYYDLRGAPQMRLATVGFTWSSRPIYVPALLLLKNNNLGI